MSNRATNYRKAAEEAATLAFLERADFPKAQARHNDAREYADASWVVWRADRVKREAHGLNEAATQAFLQQEARKASDEAATQAFLQQEARKASDEAATLAFFQNEAQVEADTQVLLQQAHADGYA